MPISTLLVIDDEPNIAFSLKEALGNPSLQVLSAGTAREGIEIVRQRIPDVIFLDVRLPDLTGLDAYDRIRQIDTRIPVIFMTAFARTETAIEAMRRGAYEYLVKPVDLKRLKGVLQKAIEVSRLNRIPAVVAETTPEDLSADRIVGMSAEMQEVYKDIGRIAPQNSTVLILGESGTGKELVARALYHYSTRNQQPFLAINCASLPETILESELFGHERGAFTGADQRRIGKFEQVNGGTIFLDEIGDMSPTTQAKALRLLQEQQFERIGGNTTVKTDVRIIAATNRDLRRDVAEGRFRQDLLYRLNGFVIHLPPLRERLIDIPLLAEHFLRLYNVELNKNVGSVSTDAMTLLQTHDWPGNIREFQSAIRYAMIQTTGTVITPDTLPQSCTSSHGPLPSRTAPVDSAGQINSPRSNEGSPIETPEATTGLPFDLHSELKRLLLSGAPDIYRHLVQTFDRIVITEVMKFVEGNQVHAAERLGISRMTLRSKLRGIGHFPDRTSDQDNTSSPIG